MGGSFKKVLIIGAAVAAFTCMSAGQASAQNVVSDTPALTPSKEAPQALEETDTLIDPASLLPDLPALPIAKASLIGGTIGKLDRVRDQLTVQVFGGGKMKIAFDTRTRIFHDGAEANPAELHQGDRVYVDTILDGSTVFARSIRLKNSATAGESQGIVTSYRADKGELQMRDALSPRSIKIRITPQTKIVNGKQVVSASTISEGTLVAVKFGTRQEGGEVAREVSILALPGASFTFGGIVTAIDLRLGLLVITSSTDHKSYEIYLGPSVKVDDSVRPSADVTVLARFENNRYVARSLTVNFANQH